MVSECQTTGIVSAEVESGSFHRLSDGDFTTRLPCVQSAGNSTAYWETPGHVGGRPAPNSGCGDGLHLQAVPLRLLP